jgi:hypothetical protein
MEIMRLTGWQRLGIALSVIWALGAGIRTHNTDVAAADNFDKFAYKVCSDGKLVAHDSDLSSCSQEREENLVTWMKNSNANVAIAALAPIPFGWLAGFILLYVGRAQVVGFRAVVPWATLTSPKKVFVVFCVLASFAAALDGLTVVMNLYVDTQVPLGLGVKAMVIRTGDNLVTVEGTWTRSGPTEGSSMGYPLQTSRIECNKEERRCTEARASVGGTVLMSDLVEYDVESWTASSIVLRLDAPCATSVFTIDLNTNAVSGAGHATNNDTALCKMYPDKEESWNYQLSDGFKIYWAQRQKSRPLPLRLIQTLFGN